MTIAGFACFCLTAVAEPMRTAALCESKNKAKINNAKINNAKVKKQNRKTNKH